MPFITQTLSSPIRPSFRVEQLRGMFDLPERSETRHCFEVEVPDAGEPWQIGAIIGPSGSGKSTVARAAFGEALFRGGVWPADAAVIDGFGDASLKTVTRLLAAVGFSSPPSWLKPFAVLSRGEQFRCELARALLEPGELVAFDEFTSVVDRTVARVASQAVARALREKVVDKRLVVVSCHDDILPWLAPDWVLDMATRQLARGCLRRRESIALEVVRCRHAAWSLFAPHHYLSGSLSPAAQCYLAAWNDRPVAFCAVMPLYGYKGRRRISRVVTLPDFQGIGAGTRLMECVAELERERGHRVNITTSHPAMIAHCARSPLWRTVQISRVGHGGAQRSQTGKRFVSTARRNTVSFEYAAQRAPQFLRHP